MLENILKDSETVSQTAYYKALKRTASYDEYIVVVAKDGRMLSWVPSHLITYEMRKVALKNCGMAIHHIRPTQRTRELLQIAVTQDGRAIAHIPDCEQTEELAKLAISQSASAIFYVVPTIINEEMWRLAIKQNRAALSFAPDHIKAKFQNE